MRRQADGRRFPRFTARILPTLILSAAALTAASRALAQVPQEAETPASPQATVKRARRIVVSIPDRKLALVAEGRVVKIYRVAVGAIESPTPSGEFKIVHRIPNPTYYAPGVVLPPGPENPLGTHWIGLNSKSFGIHGTNQPGSIGHKASHGCVRMHNRDVADLFERVRAGDVAEVLGERTEETAKLFGRPRIHPGAQPPVALSAQAAPAGERFPHVAGQARVNFGEGHTGMPRPPDAGVSAGRRHQATESELFGQGDPR